jgi:hypothetical protein
MIETLKAQISVFDYCIEQVRNSIYFHLEEYSDQYYGFMEDIKRMEDKRNELMIELISELNSIQSK